MKASILALALLAVALPARAGEEAGAPPAVGSAAPAPRGMIHAGFVLALLLYLNAAFLL